MRSQEKSFSLRLTPKSVARIDEHIRADGLVVFRADIAGTLIVRALGAMCSDPQTWLASKSISDASRN